MKKQFFLFAFVLGSLSFGQEIWSLPPDSLISREDMAVLNNGSSRMFQEFDKIGGGYGQSVVAIFAGDRQVSSGIIVAPGKVMTKYSDLVVYKIPLVIIGPGNEVHDCQVLKAFREHDILLLDVPGLKSPPVDFSKTGEVSEGGMVFVVPPGGKVTNFGVISVNQRSLREEDQAYIGILSDFSWRRGGARIAALERNSPAHLAGLLPGDIVEQVNGKKIEGFFSLRTSLNGVKPGDKIEVLVKRGDREARGHITAGNRPRTPSYPQSRLEMMNSTTPMNRRRGNFPLVYQSDMTLAPRNAGSPVIDLDGKLVGMALSRAGRTETYILPAWALHEMVKSALGELDNKDIPVAEPVEE